ncbi:MAG: M48 family metallopeptidase [Gammaproteobacteria bacterium]|nr:M48 family metallopeptidase [Rhodocyclaceae bacterium]MBU3909383.1 M48 family metallopeptidase [Gammaproteobacteria bacterium]MBU3990204.1 M48 family metallopeptidase [Gammaproteobacteria bacterium]MBU4005457.1 M48 family metallopeptidase [Gammaproteobacteria bacterium]MBU4020990.1 M48 family metallopeptidase [Gammaproteobacteria bacterium]
MQLELFRLPPILSGEATKAHHLILSGRIVSYALRRDRRRLTMRIDERGLAVGAPRNLPLGTIEAFIQSHGDWVLKKLDEFASHTTPRHLPIHEGARLPLLGEEVRVRVTAGNNRGLWKTDGQEEELWLAARPAANLALLARRALQRRALEHFQPRLAASVAQIDRPLPPLALSSARTRWGSCSARTGIRLNWRLIHLPPKLIDYVISHEVAHLLEMNHSQRFWNVVARLHPDWRDTRNELKRLGAALPLI